MHCNLCHSNDIHKKFRLRDFDVLLCKKCGLVFLSQSPTEEELKELYSSDYYLERKEYYFNNIITNPETGNRNETIETFSMGLKKLNVLKPDKGTLLDVGCGLGIFLQMAGTDGWETCGVDVSPYAVQYAREMFGVEVYNSGRLKDVGLPANSFDVVTLWDSLEHFPDPVSQLREINRVLKQDGLIMLDIPNEASLLRVLAGFLYVLTGGFFSYPVRKLYHKYHLHYFNRLAVKTVLTMGGFEILSLEEKTIPTVKARGGSLEKGLVKLLSYVERCLGMEYELFVIAKKVVNV